MLQLIFFIPLQFPDTHALSRTIFSDIIPRDQIKPDHSGPFPSDTDRQTRPTSVSRTTRPNQYQSVRPTDQTRPPFLSPPITARPASRQNANELLLIQVRSIPYGLGQGRLIYRALDEPCKAYYPHTFGLKSLDFYFRL